MGVYSSAAKAYLKENAPVGSLIELTCDIVSAEHAMFETMIELDFREAYIDKGLIPVNEAEDSEEESGSEKEKGFVGKIIDKIKGLIDKFVNWLRKFVGNLVNKFNEFIGRDKKILEKLKPIKDNFNDYTFSGDKEIFFLRYSAINKFSQKQIDFYSNIIDKIIDVKTVSDIEKIEKELPNMFDQVSDELEQLNLQFPIKRKISEIKSTDVDEIYEQLSTGYSNLIGDVKKQAETVSNMLIKIKNINYDNMEKDAREILSSEFKVISELEKEINKGVTATINNIKSYFGKTRKSAIIIIASAKKASGEEEEKKEDKEENIERVKPEDVEEIRPEKEAAEYIESLCMMSDIIVEEAFEDVA